MRHAPDTSRGEGAELAGGNGTAQQDVQTAHNSTARRRKWGDRRKTGRKNEDGRAERIGEIIGPRAKAGEAEKENRAILQKYATSRI